MDETADRLRWVDVDALRAEEAARPNSTLADAAYSLWRAVDLLDDADDDRLRAEGAEACRWGLHELHRMVGLLHRRHAAAARRATASGGPPAPAGRP